MVSEETSPAGAGGFDRDAELRQLAADARTLTAGVSRLMGETGQTLTGVAERSRRTRRWVYGLAVSLLLDVVLTVVLGFVIHTGQDNTARIDRLSSSLRVNLCGELALFVNSDTPQARAAAKARGDDLAVRDRAFRIIHQSYDSLHCSEYVH